MTARRLKWKTYWAFAKLARRWPRKAERTIIKSMANEAEGLIAAIGEMWSQQAEPVTVVPSVWGFPIVEDDRLAPDEWYLDGINYWHMGAGPCPKCHDTGFVLTPNYEDHGVSFESEACECEIGQSYVRAEETLCGCGHGDARTCPCEEIDDLPADPGPYASGTIHLGPAPPMRDVLIEPGEGPVPSPRAIEEGCAAAGIDVVVKTKTTPEDLIAWGMCPECCEPEEYCECVEHPSKATGQFDHIADLEACDEDD